MLADVPEAQAEAARYGVPPGIHAEDFIYRHHLEIDPNPDREAARRHAAWYYFWDGDRSAQRLDALIGRTHPARGTRPLALLEFASGYGCVSRHLGRMGDRYDLLACDIHPQATRFLTDTLGIAAIGSASDPDDFHSDRRFDVVFALSFFSHMPPTSFERWLRALFSTLAEDGVLIFTTHGQVGYREVGQPALHPDGHWFAPLSEQKDLPTSDYGCMVVTPTYVLERLLALEAGLVLFEEASWWGTQDLFVVRRRPDGFRRAGDAAPGRQLAQERTRADALARALDIVRGSTSWRVTAPLRALGRTMFRRR